MWWISTNLQIFLKLAPILRVTMQVKLQDFMESSEHNAPDISPPICSYWPNFSLRCSWTCYSRPKQRTHQEFRLSATQATEFFLMGRFHIDLSWPEILSKSRYFTGCNSSLLITPWIQRTIGKKIVIEIRTGLTLRQANCAAERCAQVPDSWKL